MEDLTFIEIWNVMMDHVESAIRAVIFFLHLRKVFGMLDFEIDHSRKRIVIKKYNPDAELLCRLYIFNDTIIHMMKKLPIPVACAANFPSYDKLNGLSVDFVAKHLGINVDSLMEVLRRAERHSVISIRDGRVFIERSAYEHIRILATMWRQFLNDAKNLMKAVIEAYSYEIRGRRMEFSEFLDFINLETSKIIERVAWTLRGIPEDFKFPEEVITPNRKLLQHIESIRKLIYKDEFLILNSMLIEAFHALRHGDVKKCEQVLGNLLKKFPNDRYLKCLLAFVRLVSGKYEEVVSLLDEVMREGCNSYISKLLLAFSLMSLGNEEMCEKVLRLDEYQITQSCSYDDAVLSKSLMRLGVFDLLVEVYSCLKERFPENYRLRWVFGWILANIGALDKAHAELTDAISIAESLTNKYATSRVLHDLVAMRRIVNGMDSIFLSTLA